MIDMTILEEKHNPILKRKDIIIEIRHQGKPTPKKEDVHKAVTDRFKGDPKKTEVIYMLTEKGLGKTKAKAFIWEDKVVLKEEKKPAAQEQPKEGE